ncbi:MAG: VOC family protein [Candidatus Helarchaeota archaeon]
MTKVLKIDKINQIGIVVHDVKKAAQLLEDFFGIGPFQILERPPEEITYKGKPQQFQIRNGLARVGELQLELIEVIQGECCQAEFLQRKGEGLHHFGIHVADIEEALSLAKENGIEVLQRGNALGAIPWAYLDTEDKFGIIFELMQIGKTKSKKSKPK